MKLSDKNSFWLALRLTIGILFICPACQATPASTRSEGFVLFAYQDNLWQVDLDGQNGLQRLTEDSTLNWSAGENFSMASDYRRVFLSPDGCWAAFSRTGLDLVLLNLANKDLIEIPGPGAAAINWSPDSRSFAFVAEKSQPDRYDDLYIYDVETGELRQVLQLENKSGWGMIRKNSAIWSQDGRSIGFLCNFEDSNLGQFCRYDIANGTWQAVGPLQRMGFYTIWLCWTADEELTNNPEEGVRCVRSGEPGGSDWTFSPDGKYVLELERMIANNVFRSSDPVRIRLYLLGANEIVWQKELDLPLRRAVWAPDGTSLFLDDDQNNTPIWKMPADGNAGPEVWLENGYLIGVTACNRC